MNGKPPRLLSLVIVPALLTLGVTVLRLVGEIRGWDPTWFGVAEAGGGTGPGEGKALLGISWLIFVFGLWFGYRLVRRGDGPRSRTKALVVSLVAIAVMFGGVVALGAADLVFVPQPDNPGEPRGLIYFVAVLAVGSAISAIAWGRAALVLFVYALLARIPVVIITWIALQQGWNTHYTQVPTFFTHVTEADRTAFLLMPQATFWPAITVVFGTAMASLGALLAGRPKAE
jgi:hypothetical protein